MKKQVSFQIAALLTLVLAPAASAHVTLTYPTGGETFAPGEEVQIVWRLLVDHQQRDWDLYLSTDGGVTWEPIQLNLPQALRSYDWTVPDVETVHARIKVVQDNEGLNYESRCDEFAIQAVATGTGPSASLPASTRLLDGYPNPVSSSMSIDYDLARREDVALDLYDVRGSKVATLVAEAQGAGSHHVTWVADHLTPGVYVLRLATRDFVSTRRIVVVR